jgi:CheY-like chemotaxis protein
MDAMRESPHTRVRRRRAPPAANEQALREIGAGHAVLGIVPRGLTSNLLKPLLRGYSIATATSSAMALRLSRQTPFEVYVIFTPLGWADPAEVSRRLRAFDPHTPIVLFATHGSADDRRAAFASGCAFVTRSDDANNLAGTIAQLVMITELRNMDATKRGMPEVEGHVRERLARLAARGRALPDERAQLRLKLEASRIYGAAGGSRANFERLWPGIYENALKRVRKAG